MNIVHEPEYIRSCEKRVIEENKEYWRNGPDVTDGAGWIYVFHSVAEEFESFFREDIFAKGLQKKENLPIISVSCEHRHPAGDEIDSSFGIQQIIHLTPEKFNGIISRVRTYVCAKFLSLTTYGKKQKLFHIQYRGIPCGDAISDKILRDASLDLKRYHFNCDYFDMDRSAYFKEIRCAFSLIEHARAILREKKPVYVIVPEWVYSQSLFVSVANSMGATVLLTPFEPLDAIQQIPPKSNLLQDIKVTELQFKRIKAFLKKNPTQIDKVGQDNMEGEHIEKESRDNLLSLLGIRNGKKNVIILPHAFADASREACRNTIYEDYNDWFLDTLRIIKDIKSVNWIIKDHPRASFYGQDSYVKRVFDQAKSENMYWCDKKISKFQLKEFVDCVVTCAGTAGLEFWSYGIPTITTSDIYYARCGVSYNMKSLEEYENTLRQINEIARPSIESVQKAKKILCTLEKIRAGSDDELTNVFTKTYLKRMECIAKIGNKGEAPVYYFCKKYSALLERDIIKNSTIYQLSNTYGS